MEWAQAIAVILANVSLSLTLFLWIRKEANADRKEITASMNDFRKIWAQESKEFHGRLCQIEQKNKSL